MNNIQEFIDFIWADGMKIIWRDGSSVIIKNYDVCLEYFCPSGGLYLPASSKIEIFDYEDFINQSIEDFSKFKVDYFNIQARKVAAKIRQGNKCSKQPELMN